MQCTGRWIGIDLGKRTYEMRYFDQKENVKGSGGKTSPEGRKKLYETLRKDDIIAVEACSLAFIMEKEMRDIGCQVIILNPGALAIIYASTKKTDKEDALKLARMIKIYNKEHLPVVASPTEEELYRRRLISEYDSLKRDRTQEINRLHALFLQCGITEIKRSELKTEKNRNKVLPQLTGYEAKQAQRLYQRLAVLEGQITELEEAISEECNKDENIKLAQTIPGVGEKVALAFNAYVGNCERFSGGKQVANYIGLVPRVDCSGTIEKYGHITRKGNNYLRALLYQAAWSMVRSKNGGALKDKFIYMVWRGKGKKKSITAIARKMAELLYTVTKNKQEYRPMPSTVDIRGMTA